MRVVRHIEYAVKCEKCSTIYAADPVEYQNHQGQNFSCIVCGKLNIMIADLVVSSKLSEISDAQMAKLLEYKP